MTALRLAEHVAHTTDVDAMLDAMTWQQFLEWHAKDIIEPIGHTGIHDILANIAAIIAQWLGAKDVTPQTFLWPDPDGGDTTDTDITGAIMALETVGARRRDGVNR